jgi:hypothetical protein
MQESEASLHSINTELKSLVESFNKFSLVVLAKFTSLEEGHQEVMEFMRDNLITRVEVADELSEFKEEFSELKEGFSELKDGFSKLKTEQSKELHRVVGAAKNQISEHIDKSTAKNKDQLLTDLRKEDIKIDKTITLLEQTNVIETKNAVSLRALGPFKSVTQ